MHDRTGFRPKIKYFSFKVADSVQNCRSKWFYIKDEQSPAAQKFGIAPFDLKKDIEKLESWDQALNEAELKETAPLITRIQTLQAGEGKGSANYDPFPSASHSAAASRGFPYVELLWAPRQVKNLGPRLSQGCTR
jgi:hypothetical protein